ncbi:MAG: PqqD family protein [Gemmatimonadales bacterium]
MRFFSRRPAVPETFVRAATVRAVQQGDRTVLMDLGGEQFYSLDAVAGRTWELLAEPRSVAALAEVLAGEYDAPVETIRSDLDELLAGLRRDGLVRTR